MPEAPVVACHFYLGRISGDRRRISVISVLSHHGAGSGGTATWALGSPAPKGNLWASS
ncbi:MAG: hypothetical protein HPY83_09755 [Anaerolineae bacterium]|nr:hypothetical protein [Anaerolineae bacterium]